MHHIICFSLAKSTQYTMSYKLIIWNYEPHSEYCDHFRWKWFTLRSALWVVSKVVLSTALVLLWVWRGWVSWEKMKKGVPIPLFYHRIWGIQQQSVSLSSDYYFHWQQKKKLARHFLFYRVSQLTFKWDEIKNRKYFHIGDF